MTRYNSLKAFEVALQAIDPSVEVRQSFSEFGMMNALLNPPVGKVIARIEAGGNNIVMIFNATGLLAGVIYAGTKGNFYAIELGAYTMPVLGKPVTVRVHNSPAALQTYLITKQADNTVVPYMDESAVNPAGAYRILAFPGRYVAIKGTQPATMLFIRDMGNGQFLTVFK